MTASARGNPSEPMSAMAAGYVQRLGIVSARPGVRVWAFVIDTLLAVTVSSPTVVGAVLLAWGDASWGPIALVVAGVVAVVILTAVQLVLHGVRGVTAGKAAMRLRSISVVNLGHPGFWRIVLRALVLAASSVVPVIGPAILLCSSLWDADGLRRSILDRLGRCWLIDIRAGFDPADAAALRRARREVEAPEREVSESLPSLATGSMGPRPVFTDRRARAAIIGVSGGLWSESARVPVVAPVPPIPPATPNPPIPRMPLRPSTPAIPPIPRTPPPPIPPIPPIPRMPPAPPIPPIPPPPPTPSNPPIPPIPPGTHKPAVVPAPDGTKATIQASERASLASGTVVRVGGRTLQMKNKGAVS